MNPLQFFLLIILSGIFLVSCDTSNTIKTQEVNPASEGFNYASSDKKAITIADEVMLAMGGRAAWDATNVISWTFFGNRQHTWHKANNTAKIYDPNDDLTVDINIVDKSGSAKKGGVEFTKNDSLDIFLDKGQRWWINDSYWLVMPFKLKDSGVTLKYVGKDTTEIGASSDVLELTFTKVGVTPDNKYHVYVDNNTRLVTQWDYYAHYQDSLPRFKSPWIDYKKYGELLLSGGAIRNLKISDISVK
ncbi:MAG: hypothetical protein V3V00_12070 [Saprospiraceae bacterium]